MFHLFSLGMLPKAVADQLRQGHIIGAETYDTCTIYFSDIVGFTSISGKSVPMEVRKHMVYTCRCFDLCFKL